jgi:hypothetical protein
MRVVEPVRELVAANMDIDLAALCCCREENPLQGTG